MMNIKQQTITLLVLSSLILYSCNTGDASLNDDMTMDFDQPNPASDSLNLDGWVLNKELSDEFEGTSLDTSRWFIEGQNGDYYIWKGRAPSQFVPHNVIVEEGKLKLRTQWEPDYDFAKENYADGPHDEAYGKWKGEPLPVTTAGIITKKRFLNGYMEVKSKAGDAAITAAFWLIGYEQELDVYEQLGKPKIADSKIKENSVRAVAHDWSPPAIRPTKAFLYDELDLPYRTAEEFHVYGAEWGEDYLKIFRDGELKAHFTQKELGTDWVLNNPMEIWLDSEIFNWMGVPHMEELPVDFEVEYLRVWQKPNDNLLARQFYGFEGPILYEDNPRPLDLLPESSIPDEYQKFWLIDTASARYLTIVKGDYASGVNSLEFSGFGKNEKLLTDKLVALTPEGAIDIPKGDYTLSMKLWVDEGRAVDTIYLSFQNPFLEIPIDISNIDRRHWVTIEHKLNKMESSANNDQFKIEIRKENVPETKAVKLFIDDIEIR